MEKGRGRIMERGYTATVKDVNKIMNHIKHLARLNYLGFQETIFFVYDREVVPLGIIPSTL